MKLKLNKDKMLGFQILETGTFRIGAKAADKPRSLQNKLAGMVGAKSKIETTRMSAKIGTKVGTKSS